MTTGLLSIINEIGTVLEMRLDRRRIGRMKMCRCDVFFLVHELINGYHHLPLCLEPVYHGSSLPHG